ncbi:MAG: hypothetical protein LBS36_00265 [Oscillospiraceae bacterium]|jgi:putative membrane fusion protein|nr:hypothetical protein [Oscillospiraceae bacterium]
MLKKNKPLIKVISALVLFALVLSFGIYQVSRFNSDPVKTQTVLLQSVYNTISSHVFVVRDESYITSNAGGVYVPLVKNGERVAGGDTVSVMMQNEASAGLFSKKKQLETDIAYYKNLSRISVAQTTDIARIDKEIIGSVADYVSAIGSGNLSGLKEMSDSVRDNITHRQIVTGTRFDFSALIASLESEYQTILDAGKQGASVIADKAGYFIAEVDGYENAVPYNNVPNLTNEEISAALQASPAETPLNVKGKLVGEFDWYLICVLDTKDTENLAVGRSVGIHFNASAAGDVKATVFKINETKNGKTSVIFKADTMSESLATLRKEAVQIRTEEYTGYRVDSRAIRMQNGEKGVFIRRGNLISFRKIEVLYEEESFYIVDKDKSGLKLYDEAIVEGADLYDGKVLT